IVGGGRLEPRRVVVVRCRCLESCGVGVVRGGRLERGGRVIVGYRSLKRGRLRVGDGSITQDESRGRIVHSGDGRRPERRGAFVHARRGGERRTARPAAPFGSARRPVTPRATPQRLFKHTFSNGTCDSTPARLRLC